MVSETPAPNHIPSHKYSDLFDHGTGWFHPHFWSTLIHRRHMDNLLWPRCQRVTRCAINKCPHKTNKLIQWRLNEHDGASNRHLDCLLNCLLRRRSERKYQSFMPLASVRGVHRWPVDSPPKGPATRKMFPFDDVVMHLMSPNSIRTIYRCTTTILVTYYLDPSSHLKSISVEISFHCHFIPGLDIFAYGTEAVVSYSISYSGWLIKPLHAKFSLET